MTEEQLNKARILKREITPIEGYIKILEWTQSESVEPRSIRMAFNGSDNEIWIPETLFKIVCKLVLTEHKCTLDKLKKEFEDL